MKVHHIDYVELSQWSRFDLAYLQHDKKLSAFYKYEPLEESVPLAIKSRKEIPVDRKLLLKVLKKQYQELDIALPVNDEIILDENTLTITTSHQPTLFTGPLFHIYKIASVIHLAQDLKKKHPDHTFLPVFVMSGEDHDWAEVNHFHLFGRRYEWNRSASGPCGRLSLEGLDVLIDTLNETLKNTPFAKDINQLFKNCLAKATNYGQFHRLLVSSLFSRFGLIVINLDDVELKKAFVPIIEKEIRERFSFPLVTAAQKELEKVGFKPQAFCRQVNLFYMTDQVRERLDPLEEGLVRIGSQIKYTIEEAIHELHQHPDRFSPNVILRPLYQESILPNIAYVGGGGEIAYWIDRKAQFNAVGIHYPMLVRRNSLLMMDAATKSQMDKLEMGWKEMFHDINSIINSYLHKHSQADLHFDMEIKMIRDAYNQLASKAEKLDPTLATAIKAEESKQIKQFEQLSSRLLRAEKQHQETNIKRIERIREKLFPGGGLQERYENFLSYYSNLGPQWIDDMVDLCDPWTEKFILVELPQQASRPV